MNFNEMTEITVDSMDFMNANIRIEETAHNIATELKVQDYYWFVIKNNQVNSSMHSCYHNIYHSCQVAVNCFEGSISEQLLKTDMKCLFVAGMFHDMNHTLGYATDDINVNIAINAFKHAALTIGNLSKEEVDKIIETIKITKYPYEEEPVTILQKIIRDADLMSIYDENESMLVKQYRGLKTEVETARSIATSNVVKFTNDEYAEGQKQWLYDNVKWYTAWAKNKAVKKDWHNKVSYLVDILKGTK